MWLPTKAFELFRISHETVAALRENNAALKLERDTLKQQLSQANINFNWLSQRVNTLEIERAQLMKVAYKIEVPVPEIVRTSQPSSVLSLTSALFEHIDDEEANKLGLN